MFEFKKLCEAYETLTPAERGAMLRDKSAEILAKLRGMPNPGIEPETVLAGFLIGSVSADGDLSEREYLMIYPSLVTVFGEDYDFASIKAIFGRGHGKEMQVRKMTTLYTREMIRLIESVDAKLRDDMIMLCMCAVSVDGHVSLKEKRYIKRLCKA